MDYVGNVIRPPSEADSIILQVTVGCSHNKCTFCGAYKSVVFSVKKDNKIVDDLLFAKKFCKKQNRVFLADGDVLILEQKKLVRIFHLIRQHLPWISRISLYGNARAIRSKSENDLLELKALGLDRVYMGLESGNNAILEKIQKGETADSMISAAKKINASGIFLSVTALLGIGGISLSRLHAMETADTLTAMAPRQIALLTLIPLANTSLGQQVLSGELILPGPFEILDELLILINQLGNIRCQLHANHASTYFPVAGRLPKDRAGILAAIEEARSGKTPLVPECRRAL